jgi:DNA polymerase-3 subunit epsilon
MQLKDLTFVCIDCEATGLDPTNERVVEVAAAKFTLNEILEQFETLIDPERLIPEAVIKVHHITQDMVKDKPKIHTILPSLFKLIGNHPIIGHGIAFDIDILTQEAQRANISCSLRTNDSIDTLRLARLYGESPTNSLEQLRKHFNIEEEGAHRAMSDVIVNIQVFQKLIKNFHTLEELFSALSKPILLKSMPLGKHKGRAFKELPLDYLLWAARQDFDQDLLFSLRSEVSRRKKGSSFSQSSNPFSLL